jgi:hypothetical protein
LSVGELATKKSYKYKNQLNYSSGSVVTGVFEINPTKELWLHEYDVNTRVLYSGEFFYGIPYDDDRVIEINSSSYTSAYFGHTRPLL